MHHPYTFIEISCMSVLEEPMKTLFSIGLGIAIFLVLRIFLKGYFFIPLLIAIFGFIVIRRLLAKIKRKDGKIKVNSMEYANKKLVEEGKRKLAVVRQKTRMIKKNDVAEKVQEICRVGLEIFDNLAKHPEDIKKAKQFINYYLDTTEKIVSQYVELSSVKKMTPEIEESLKNVEEILDSVKDTFEKQLASLLDDDLLNLDTEIKVLKRTMELEG